MSQSKDMYMEQREAEAMTEQEAPIMEKDGWGIQLRSSTLLTVTKSTLALAADKLAKRVADGDLSSVDALIYAKKGQELFSQLEKKVRPYAEDEAQISRGEKRYVHNTEIIEKAVGGSWDYSACGDVLYDVLKQEAEAANAKVKEREKFLQTVKQPMGYTDTDTGETWEIKPPIHAPGRQALAVTLK